MNKDQSPNRVIEVIGAILIGFILVVMMMQGDRIWAMIERLTIVETKVEIYHGQ